ncbi:unnamed protein product [Closterium sp. NIES-54]
MANTTPVPLPPPIDASSVDKLQLAADCSAINWHSFVGSICHVLQDAFVGPYCVLDILLRRPQALQPTAPNHPGEPPPLPPRPGPPPPEPNLTVAATPELQAAADATFLHNRREYLIRKADHDVALLNYEFASSERSTRLELIAEYNTSMAAYVPNSIAWATADNRACTILLGALLDALMCRFQAREMRAHLIWTELQSMFKRRDISSVDVLFQEYFSITLATCDGAVDYWIIDTEVKLRTPIVNLITTHSSSTSLNATQPRTQGGRNGGSGGRGGGGGGNRGGGRGGCGGSGGGGGPSGPAPGGSSSALCYPSPLPRGHSNPPLLPPRSPSPPHPFPPLPAPAVSAAPAAAAAAVLPAAAAAAISSATAATAFSAAAAPTAAVLPAAAAAAVPSAAVAAAADDLRRSGHGCSCLPCSPPPWGSIPSAPPSVLDSQGSFLGHVAAAPTVASMYPSAINETSFQYPVSPPPPSSPTLDFVLDSGATETALKDAGTLAPLPLPTQVHGADSSFSIPCTHLSTLPCTAFPSGKVTGLHIPTLRNNLLSHQELQGVGITALYPGFANYCDLYQTSSGRFLLRIPLCPRTRLYTLSTPRPSFCHITTRAGTSTSPPPPLPPPQVSPSLASLPSSLPNSSSTPSPSSSTALSHLAVILYHRLGHPNFAALRTTVTSCLLHSLPPTLPPLPSSPTPPCPSCIHGKLKQSPHHSHPTFAAAPIDLVHMDLWGPYPIRSRKGHRYMLVLVDDHSRHSTVFFLHTKDQVPAVVINWAEQCRNHFKRPIGRLHYDGGGEFINNTLATFCKLHGIQQTSTLPHSPQKYGIAKSRICEITKIARCPHCSRLHPSLPLELCPSPCRPPPQSPLPPSASLLFPHKTLPGLTLSSHLSSLPLLSSPPLPLQSLRPPLLTSMTPLHPPPRPTPLRPLFSLPPPLTPPLLCNGRASSSSNNSGSRDSSRDSSSSSRVSSSSSRVSSSSSSSSSTQVSSSSISSSRVSSSSRSSSRPRSRGSSSSATGQLPAPPLSSSLACTLAPLTRSSEPLLPPPFGSLRTPMRKAIACPDADRWIAAIFLECEAFIRNNSFVDVPLPTNANLVEGKWVFQVKQLLGKDPVYKARYCAKGFTQTWAEDYWFTYVPTAKPPTLRTLLDVGARDNMEICSMDVSNAFLQGDLHECIFLRRPPGFHAAFPKNTVWQLRRPVYGMKQAHREWHAKLSATLGSLGFSASHSGASLFLRSSPRRFFILVYMDDMILLADSKADMEQMKQQLQQRLKGKDLGDLTHYLGMAITRDRPSRTITLSQYHYIGQILEKFEMTQASPIATPLPFGHQLAPPTSPSSSSHPYAELVGPLMYAMMCTRPDLAYPISVLAHFVGPGRHTEVHWKASKRVIRYLRGTKDHTLTLGGSSPPFLLGFSDSSWADS